METEWVEMARRQKRFKKLSRRMLPQRGGSLSASECEVLASLLGDPAGNTPMR